MSVPITRHSLLVSAILFGLAGPALSQETASNAQPQATVPGQYISPEAQGVMNRMTDYMRGLQSFTVQATGSRDEVVSYGYKLQHNESATISVQRPNRMRAEVRGDLRDRSFLYDGSRLTMYSADDDAYTSTPATINLDRLVGGLLDAGVELPLVDMLYSAFAGTLTEAVRTGILVGDSTIDGVPCEQLAFRQANADWQLWVEKGARPLPRKIVITTRHEVGDPQFQAVMSWNVQPKLDKSTFVFNPPKGAQEIPFLDAPAVQGGSQ